MRTLNRSSTRQWSRATRPYFAVFFILLSSRLVAALAIVFSSQFVQRSPGDMFTDLTPRWYRYLLRWDAGWYLKIVSEGYSYNGDDSVQQSIVFHPLYPLISKAVAVILGISDGASLLVVANILIVIAVLLTFKLVKESFGAETALYTVAALSFFPTSLFFSAGYTESLALLLIVSCFLLLKKKRYLLASVFVSLTLATRPASVVLMLPLVWELWREFSGDFKRLATIGGSCLIIATAGVWMYMIYLWAVFNRPLAILTSHRAWHGSGSMREFLQILTLQPFKHLADILKFGPFPIPLAPWFFLLFVLLLAFFHKRLPTSYALYAMGVLLVPYIIASGNVGFGSFTRYQLLGFPIFIIIGEQFKRWRWLRLSGIGLFAALLFMYTAFFCQFYFVG
jgi:Gpi18-like mannosyltransferase